MVSLQLCSMRLCLWLWAALLARGDEEAGDPITSQVVSLGDLTWPAPPPSPPGLPPAPPPDNRLNMTAAQLECQFEQGIDLTLIGDDLPSTAVASAVDTQMRCCALCAIKSRCTRFVFIPDSGACAMLPSVPKNQLIRTSNPATVAGAVFIAHGERAAPAVRHTQCSYEIGFSYSGGALGAGQPVDGPRITSQQGCCDACQRHSDCVKFVYERFGGGCQLFESFADKYHTPGLIAGSIDERAALGYAPGTTGKSGLQATYPPFVDPPAPPSFAVSISVPPPLPPTGENAAAQAVLKYASIGIGSIIIFGFMLCGYCFYFSEIQLLLHRWTDGRFGQAEFSLLPKSLQEAAMADAAGTFPCRTSRTKRGIKKPKLLVHKGLPVGWTSVTCVTTHVTQTKDVQIDLCQSFEELRDHIWEEFAHLLKHLHRKSDAALMCFVGDEAKVGRWLTVTSASDIGRVCACGALKLTEVGGRDHGVSTQGDGNQPAVAFAKVAPKRRVETEPDAVAVQSVALVAGPQFQTAECQASRHTAKPGSLSDETGGGKVDLHAHDPRSGTEILRPLPLPSTADAPLLSDLPYEPAMVQAVAQYIMSRTPQDMQVLAKEPHTSPDMNGDKDGHGYRGAQAHNWSDEEQSEHELSAMDRHDSTDWLGRPPPRAQRRPTCAETVESSYHDNQGVEVLLPEFAHQVAQHVPAGCPGASQADSRSDDSCECTLLSEQGEAMVGKRVKICRLQSKVELNGCASFAKYCSDTCSAQATGRQPTVLSHTQADWSRRVL